MKPLTILQLNIEGDRHYQRILPLIEKEQPDVLCFQEVYEADLNIFQSAYPYLLFAPLVIIQQDTNVGLVGRGRFGIAIFSKLPFLSTEKMYYVGNEKTLHVYINGQPNLFNRAVIFVEIEFEGKRFRIATTHFTWSHGGSVTEEQQRDLDAMLPIIKELKPLIFTGDFNAPRGKAIFAQLASVLKDNVPVHLQTSIDQNFHRVKGLQLMVDGFFTSPEFTVTEIEMIDGVSDHQALLGKVESSL